MKFVKMTEITQEQLNSECKELFRYGQMTSDINDLSDDVSREEWSDRSWRSRKGIRYDLVTLCKKPVEIIQFQCPER